MKKKRVRRPRALEMWNCSAWFSIKGVFFNMYPAQYDLKYAKKLHAWLTKAIAYLESKEK